MPWPAENDNCTHIASDLAVCLAVASGYKDAVADTTLWGGRQAGDHVLQGDTNT